jgi:hypothetical protein
MIILRQSLQLTVKEPLSRNSVVKEPSVTAQSVKIRRIGKWNLKENESSLPVQLGEWEKPPCALTFKQVLM